MWDPQTIAALQQPVRSANGDGAGAPTRSSPAASTRRTPPSALLRGLLGLRARRQPVPLDEVEPATEIVKRFVDRRDEPRRALARRRTRRWRSR